MSLATSDRTCPRAQADAFPCAQYDRRPGPRRGNDSDVIRSCHLLGGPGAGLNLAQHLPGPPSREYWRPARGCMGRAVEQRRSIQPRANSRARLMAKISPHHNSAARFTMRVRDVFDFGDGRTVFTGEAADEPGNISESDCHLVIDGVKVTEFRIEGEMLPLRKKTPHLRAISTTAVLDVDHIRSFLAKGTATVEIASREPAGSRHEFRSRP